jgi:hypothetical protein
VALLAAITLIIPFYVGIYSKIWNITSTSVLEYPIVEFHRNITVHLAGSTLPIESSRPWRSWSFANATTLRKELHRLPQNDAEGSQIRASTIQVLVDPVPLHRDGKGYVSRKVILILFANIINFSVFPLR